MNLENLLKIVKREEFEKTFRKIYENYSVDHLYFGKPTLGELRKKGIEVSPFGGWKYVEYEEKEWLYTLDVYSCASLLLVNEKGVLLAHIHPNKLDMLDEINFKEFKGGYIFMTKKTNSKIIEKLKKINLKLIQIKAKQSINIAVNLSQKLIYLKMDNILKIMNL